jgi:hypothetical protein
MQGIKINNPCILITVDAFHNWKHMTCRTFVTMEFTISQPLKYIISNEDFGITKIWLGHDELSQSNNFEDRYTNSQLPGPYSNKTKYQFLQCRKYDESEGHVPIFQEG